MPAPDTAAEHAAQRAAWDRLWRLLLRLPMPDQHEPLLPDDPPSIPQQVPPPKT
jgi:hypothetical protein